MHVHPGLKHVQYTAGNNSEYVPTTRDKRRVAVLHEQAQQHQHERAHVSEQLQQLTDLQDERNYLENQLRKSRGQVASLRTELRVTGAGEPLTTVVETLAIAATVQYRCDRT